jgi:hypothetical protein
MKKNMMISLNYGPDLFKLLIETLNDKKMKSELRLRVSAALAYMYLLLILYMKQYMVSMVI